MRAGAVSIVAAATLFGLCGVFSDAQQAPTLKIWSADIHDSEDSDTGGPAAVSIVAARNGWHSGKVVVAAAGGVKASVSDLVREGGGVIPSRAVLIRYAAAQEGPLAGANESKGPDMLPEECPAASSLGRVPVWVTVKVPKNTPPGTYAGHLTVSASGSTARVPVAVEVAGWTAPDPADHISWLELMQSPDTLAEEYGVALWSEKHWELIGRSMKFLADAGACVLYIPLIERTNVGNEESMVRWVESGNDRYRHDFSIAERYLDLALSAGMKPRAVIFNVWDRYLTRPGAGGRDFQTQAGLRVAASGPRVTIMDAEGRVRHVVLPDYPSRESITVSIERITGGRRTPTADEYLQQRVEEMKTALVSFCEQERGSATIDGADARYLVFSCRMGPFTMSAMLYVFIHPKGPVSVTCLSRPDRFQRCRPIFEEAAAGLKILPSEVSLTIPEGWTKADFQYRETGVGYGVVAIGWGPKDAADSSDAVRDAWKELFSGLRQRMKSRGLEGTMLVGMVSDFWATREQAEFIQDVSGGLPWANASHYLRPHIWGFAPVGYSTFYFGARFGYTKSLKGWSRPEAALTFDRSAFLDGWPMARWRHMVEASVTGNTRGVGRLGADTWNVFRDRQGNRKGRVSQRYPESDWGYLNIRSSVLAPGPSGAVATTRYEVLREGIQDAEARILIEKALSDTSARAKLPSDLVAACEEALAERTFCLWEAVAKGVGTKDDAWRVKASSPEGNAWFLASGWQARSHTLYTLAGQVDALLK